MVTQILPVRYVPVGKLVDNLRPLLSDNASISSNDSSNAVILTDTQTNIHRIAEIIHALDTSVSSISVDPRLHLALRRRQGTRRRDHAAFRAQHVATTTSSKATGPTSRVSVLRRRRRAAAGGQPQRARRPESAAMQAASRVVAVADETTQFGRRQRAGRVS